MKLFHLADLHLGKRVNDFSLLEDQQYILGEILKHVDSEELEGLIIAGDVYDKSTPSTEAVRLFDEFLVQLQRRNIKVFIISGNHDSPERISFASRIMKESQIFVAPVYEGKISKIELSDEYGEVNVYLLPFIKPLQVRKYYPQETIENYTEAIATIINDTAIDSRQRNILVGHQLVTGGERSESEEISVGGSENVDRYVFKDFDYVALGHLHRPQNIKDSNIRYSGSPLKYSFSEINHNKAITVVELKEKGKTEVTEIPLLPKRDMQELKNTYQELCLKDNYQDINTTDYFHVVLTDEEVIPDAISKLRAIYPNIMKLDYAKQKNNISLLEHLSENSPDLLPQELFAQFYTAQNNKELNTEQEKIISSLVAKIWEEKS